MRWKAGLLVGCLASLTGCTTLKISGHNLIHEPALYEDERKIEHRLRQDGRKIWQTIACAYPDRTFSPDFRDGFLDGYGDYLNSGGTASPPLVPPVRYRRSKYFCPEGQALVRDYFAGFKYGAEVACASGQRQFLTVPVLLPVQKPEQPLNISTGDKPTALPAPPPLPSQSTAGRTPPVPPSAPGSNPLDKPKPVADPSAPSDAVPPAVSVPPSPPGSGGATDPRLEEPKASPLLPTGPRVPPAGKIRPASATTAPIPAEPSRVIPADYPPVGGPPVG